MPGEARELELIVQIVVEIEKSRGNIGPRIELKGILAFEEAPLVSSDFKKNSNSSIVDAENTNAKRLISSASGF